MVYQFFSHSDYAFMKIFTVDPFFADGFFIDNNSRLRGMDNGGGGGGVSS